MTDAYLLVFHGSRDPRPQIAVRRLVQQLSAWLPPVVATGSARVVGIAQLELAQTPLHVQISDFANECAPSGIERVVILPLFLIPGVHVMADIPAEVALANDRGQIQSIVAPFLGAQPDFVNLFVRNRSSITDRAIILAHGSRRSGGNQIVEDLAAKLDVLAAYWSVTPSLLDRVTELVAIGASEIEILPYFLFAGGITDAIAASIAQLSIQFPQVKLTLGEPMGNSPELVAVIGKLIGSIDLENLE